ncbi:MAG: hypothetical protein LV480_09485 [Methylacidiphilales bacterium]|nr:hypothetical protein [Candidatus Methylacidiphilales bacterium]
MNKEREVLSRIDALPEPRHLFVLPSWLDPVLLDRLIKEGYLTCFHQQRDDAGALHLAMGLKLTAKAERLIRPKVEWRDIALKGSVAAVSLAILSGVILYLG